MNDSGVAMRRKVRAHIWQLPTSLATTALSSSTAFIASISTPGWIGLSLRCGSFCAARLARTAALRLGHLLDERVVARPLVAAQALEQRGEEELGIGDALVLALVARVRRRRRSRSGSGCFSGARCLSSVSSAVPARSPTPSMRSVRFERLDAQRMAAVVLEMAREERMRPPGSRRSRPARRPPAPAASSRAPRAPASRPCG